MTMTNASAAKAPAAEVYNLMVTMTENDMEKKDRPMSIQPLSLKRKMGKRTKATTLNERRTKAS